MGGLPITTALDGAMGAKKARESHRGRHEEAKDVIGTVNLYLLDTGGFVPGLSKTDARSLRLPGNALREAPREA